MEEDEYQRKEIQEKDVDSRRDCKGKEKAEQISSIKNVSK